jgi:hypothetical protein
MVRGRKVKLFQFRGTSRAQCSWLIQDYGDWPLGGRRDEYIRATTRRYKVVAGEK